ncbi:hypothetical protein ACN92M_26720 (plasmid) [Paenibacillus polymyxa]|uniref:hypothetical protein n=1 Tax=Paenibacillus polymyxa TaxID=1406 RepID=UPI003B5B4FFB
MEELSMKISLSGLGWVSENPVGHRLRWNFPPYYINGKAYIPSSFIIERVSLSGLELNDNYGLSTLSYPYDWWTSYERRIKIAENDVLFTYSFETAVQAISFLWEGSNAQFHFCDGGRTVFVSHVKDGDRVYVEKPTVDSFIVISSGGNIKTLKGLRLNYALNDAKWERIAEIAVADSYQSDLSVVRDRYGDSTTMSQCEWDDLRQAMEEAKNAMAPEVYTGEPTAWDQVEFMLSVRWEYAVLGGFAYYDGPHLNTCELDTQIKPWLEEPGLYAYRVYPFEHHEWCSNIVFCRSTSVDLLKPPSVPRYNNAEVRLNQPVNNSGTPTENLHLANECDTPSDEEAQYPYNATLTIESTLDDPKALGLEYEELVESSPTIHSTEIYRCFFHRSGDNGMTPKLDKVSRSFGVDFPDVRLRARCRAVDGWDRVSEFSDWTPPTSLQLRHEPSAPPLLSAQYKCGEVCLTRNWRQNGGMDWTPDSLISQIGGNIEVYRQINRPRTSQVNFGTPQLVLDGKMKAFVTSETHLSDFMGGTFQAGLLCETILDIDDQSIYWRAVDTAGQGGTLFGSGKGKLIQDEKHPSLWVKVAEFPVENLPKELVFSDLFPASDKIEVESYFLRIAYWDRLGPPGEIVRSIRHPEMVLPSPPMFTVEQAGIDFYHRSLIKVSLNQPIEEGTYTLWWADGIVGTDEIPTHGTMGSYPNQTLQDGRFLYDVLPLPNQQKVPRTMTIGIQATTTNGLMGAMTTTTFDIQPLN